jgi:hypothetical protein
LEKSIEFILSLKQVDSYEDKSNLYIYSLRQSHQLIEVSEIDDFGVHMKITSRFSDYSLRKAATHAVDDLTLNTHANKFTQFTVFNFRVAVKGSLQLDLNKEFIKKNVEIKSPVGLRTNSNLSIKYTSNV